jgi:hypothetical protein
MLAIGSQLGSTAKNSKAEDSSQERTATKADEDIRESVSSRPILGGKIGLRDARDASLHIGSREVILLTQTRQTAATKRGRASESIGLLDAIS